MGYDLFLTETGDITFSAIDFSARTDIFDFNFYVAPSEVFLFNFMIENNSNSVLDNKEKMRANVYINSIDDLDYIENPKVGTKIHIAETNTIYRITTVNEISFLDEEPVNKVGDIQPVEFSSNFTYEFYTHELKNDKRGLTVHDNSYIQQAIKIRLNSESGSIRGNEKLGANLFTLMHSEIDTPKLLTKVSALVKNAISDILPNCTVKAYTINSDYFNYHNTIKIVIINNEEVYYYYV